MSLSSASSSNSSAQIRLAEFVVHLRTKEDDSLAQQSLIQVDGAESVGLLEILMRPI